MTRVLICTVALLALLSCGGGATSTSSTTTTSSTSTATSGVSLSEREEYRYNKALADVEAIEAVLQAKEHSAESVAKMQQMAKALTYEYNADGMNAATIEHCEKLRKRIEKLKGDFKGDKVEVKSTVKRIKILSHNSKLITESVEFPFYVEAGEKVVIEHSASEAVTVRLNNADTQRTIKTYNQTIVKDSVKVAYSGIYTLSVTPRGRCYSSLNIYTYGTKLVRKRVQSETVKCNKGDWGAKAVTTIKMHNCFEEPRKLTLRGQLKAMFSGNDKALVAVQVPTGTTDILYSLRVATSEQSHSSDGEFHNNLTHSYTKIKTLGLPLYEREKTRGVFIRLLDDNRPIREEDAYCNMYVFRSQSEAKQFQDSTKPASQLNYDVDFSTIGTQSCNGRIPTKGARTIYLGFENERMRYVNYIWLEVVAVVPTTEYYRTKYSVQ